MSKKLFMLWTFLLCFVGGISAAEITIDANNSTFAADANGNIVATSGDVTFTYEKGGSSSDIAGGLQASELRVYKSSTFTVSSTKNITKIVFTTTKATNDADGFTTSTGTYTVDATNSLVGTWEGTSSSVTFEASGHQVRLSKIVVTLDESEAAVKTPALTPAGGSYLGTQSVTISCETADAKIYYTLDGNDPTAESTEYTAPVEITETATLKAIAIKGEDKSSIASASYTILANIANTVDAPMTVAEALAAIANNSAETLKHADNKVYVKGIVKYISEISTYYGNATYSIVNAEGDADTLLIFRGKYLDDAKFTAEDSAKFVPGSTVVIYGNLLNYNGTPEMAANNYLVSFEEPKAEAAWKDIKVDINNLLTDEEKAAQGTAVNFGITVDTEGNAVRVAADDPSAVAVISGNFHSDHGLTNSKMVVAVEGKVKVGIGNCTYGNHVAKFTTAEGVVTNIATKATCHKNDQSVSYGYYMTDAPTTLTIQGADYNRWFSVEKVVADYIVTYYNEAYTTADATYTKYSEIPYAEGETITIVDGTPQAPTGMKFSHWATADGTEIKGGEAAANLAIYPVWVDAAIKIGATEVGVTVADIYKYENCVSKGEQLIDSSHDGSYVLFNVLPEVTGTYTFTSKIATTLEGTGVTLGIADADGNFTSSEKKDISNSGSWTEGTDYTWNIDLIAGQVYTIKALCHSKDIYCVNLFDCRIVKSADLTPTGYQDFAINLQKQGLLTTDEFESKSNTSFGVYIDKNGGMHRVASDSELANFILNGKYHNDHGWLAFSAKVPVEGPVKIGMGTCQFGSGDVTITDASGATVATMNTNDGSTCYDASKPETIVYTEYKGGKTTLTITSNNYSPFLSVEKILPTDITVDVASGDIAAAVDSVKATVAIVGNITINLKKDAAYTVSKSIEIPAGLVINGDSAKIDASALDAPFIVMSATPSVELINEYYRVGQVYISNVVVDSIKNSIFYDNNTKYCVVDFAIDNSVLNLATTAVQNEALVSFKMGGAKDVNITNSTIYGNGVAKYFIRYNNSARLDRYGFDKTTEFQTMNYQNNTFYNVIQTGGQWGNYNGIGGQNFSKFDVQKNIWYNSSNEIIRRMAGGRFSGSNPMTFAKNTYFYNDADNSAKEASYDKSGDILITDPTFADAATGNFTLHVGTQQAKEKTGDPRWLVEYDATQAFALPIVVDVVEGDILAAVDSVKATVDKVGDITINLAKGTTYTVSNSVLAPANLVINGDSAIIDATALAAPMIITDTVALAEALVVENIAINNVVVKGLGQALFYSSGQKRNITNFVVDNAVIEVAKDVTVFDFTKGSVAMNFAVKNSTLYAPTATTKSVYSSQGGEKASAYGATAEAPQTFAFENSTIYNITSGKNFFSHRQNSQTWIKYAIKNNIVVNSGKANFMQSINGGGDSANPQYDVTTNSVGTLADGTYTDLSASQMVKSVVMGTLVTTDPQFKDAAAADFTVYAGSDQAKEKIGDPRWLVEFDETLSGIEGITTDGSSVNGANNDAWYNLQGVRVNGKPTQKGIYIHNGKKIVVK